MKRYMQITFPLFLGLISAYGHLNTINPNGLFFKNWEGKKAPIIKAQSIYGDSIVTRYPADHHTLLIMTEIGCLPCMMELSALPRVNEHFGSRLKTIVLASQTKEQMIDFNSKGNGIMARIRRQFKIDSITDPILAGCDKEKKKKKFHLGAECRKWEKVFKSMSYPTTLLVDKNGVVKYMPSGFTVRFTHDNRIIRPDSVSADLFIKELEKKMEN